MSATLSIINLGTKTAYSHTGDINNLAKAIASVAFRDETLAEAITRAAIEIDLKKQVDEQLISMTQ